MHTLPRVHTSLARSSETLYEHHSHNCWSSAGGLLHPRTCKTRQFSGSKFTVLARRSRRDDDYVEFDEDWENEKANTGFNLDFLPATSGKVLSTLQTLTDRFVDVVYEFFPAGTSRSVVETTTKGGVLLVTLAFASSILSFLLNAGVVVLGLYVAAKVFGVDVGGLGSNKNSNTYRQDRDSDPPPRRSKQTRSFLGRNRASDDDDLTDVWFEEPSKKAKRR